MARKGVTGYATLFMPDAPVKEFETFTCNHCNKGRPVKPGNNYLDGVGDLCYGCDSPVCEGCARRLAQGFKCEVFEVKLARYEARERFRASL